jgi:hypothetical protein
MSKEGIMGDRVTFQVHNSKTGEYGPIIFSHYAGERVESTIAYFKQMWVANILNCHNVGYATGNIIGHVGHVKVWNAHKLSDGDMPGDAGAVLLDVATGQVTCLGGYLNSSDYNLTE